MLTSSLRTRSVFAGRASVVCVAFIVLLFAFLPTSAATAAGPATVTVRVEGATKTLVPPTEVTTTTEPVVNGGNPSADSCPGTSGLGALQLATGGNWEGTWYGGEVKEGKFEGLGYSVESIVGESYPFSGGSFWDFWIDDKAEEENGLCSAEMQTGDQVLLFPCHYEEGKECPNPLAVEAPTSANVDESVPVTVKRYNAKGEASPSMGATVTGASIAAMTDSGGHATVSFSSAGEFTLQASASESVRDEITICVHNGNDGTCGTRTSPGSSPGSTSGGSTPSGGLYKGEYALVPKLTGLIEGHTYKRGHAPRVLSGTVLAHTAVTSISLELRRLYRGRCYTFDGVTTRFVRARCGTGSMFKVSNNGLFSYLLPETLRPGRYVLDIDATDAAGNHTTLARGTSRIVFYVQ